jgi:hypothetical protein
MNLSGESPLKKGQLNRSGTGTCHLCLDSALRIGGNSTGHHHGGSCHNIEEVLSRNEMEN